MAQEYNFNTFKASSNNFFQNGTMKAYVIQSKNKNIIEKSSSGGMFAELAKFVLSQNGVVFGCTMERVEEGFEVKHIYIENENNLYKLQGSKYVQSKIGNTLKQAKEFLEQGRLVLYSGTPCQIAGLKAFLNNKEYDNLLTVDVSCTGTPSIEIFNDYIKFLENKYKQKIINFEFRNKKKMGWSCGNAIITFKNGKQKIIYNNISSFLNLFINKKIQAKRCQICQYTGLERISDITLADAWGIEQEYSELLNKKFNKNIGISLILLNSEKGRLFFNFIQNKLVFQEININKMIKYNNPLNGFIEKQFDNYYLEEYEKQGYKGIENKFKVNIGKKYYYYIIKNHTPKFIKSIIKVFINKQEKVDCLLMTLFCLSNYGSLLTAYALHKTINNLGYSTKLIYYGNIYGYGEPFIRKYLSLTKRCINIKDFINLNKITNTFILGSDNLINLETNKLEFIAQNLFNYTEENKKRIMISGSMGSWNGSTKNQEEYNYIKYLFNRFDYLSTREEHGKKVLETVFNCEADWINDPVFYLTKEDYIELIKNVKENYNNKIMQYILYPNADTNSIVDFYKKKFDAEIVKFEGNENVKYFSKYKGKKVENWLAAIINSKLIITDSFHCVAFALIFNKPFICIKNTHATVRFTSLFKRLGITIPIIENARDFKNTTLTYDIERVNTKLKDIRDFAVSKIEKILIEPKKETIMDNETEKYNFDFMQKITPWYKRNKLFYFSIIIPFVIPFIKVTRNMKNRNAKYN